MPRSQEHGFLWENDVKTNGFDLPAEKNNTDTHDISKEKNKYNKNENVSNKSTGSETICCSDILRFFNYNFEEKNTIIVIHYDQTGTHKIVKNTYEIDYNAECHKHLFGDLPREVIEEYVANVKSIPKKTKGKDAKKIFDYLGVKEEINKNYTFNAQINPKVDSKQSRVQCSITNFKQTLKDFIIYDSMKETNQPNILRGIPISPSFISSRRARNGLSCEKLKNLCKSNGLKKYSKLKKEELIELLNKNNIKIQDI